MTQNATSSPSPTRLRGGYGRHRGYYDLELAYEELERRHKSAMRDLGKLRKQLGRQRYLEVEADDVIAVLEFWQATLNSRASITPESDNWKMVQKRLRDKDARSDKPLFDVLWLKAAVVGITLDPWRMEKGESRRQPREAFKNPDRSGSWLAGRWSSSKRPLSALHLVSELGGEVCSVVG